MIDDEILNRAGLPIEVAEYVSRVKQLVEYNESMFRYYAFEYSMAPRMTNKHVAQHRRDMHEETARALEYLISLLTAEPENDDADTNQRTPRPTGHDANGAADTSSGGTNAAPTQRENP